VPIRAARRALIRVGASRVGQAVGLAALALLLAGQGLRSAVADGDTRTISLHHIHTGEDLTITYKRNGQFDPDALKKINHILRDWRKDEEIQMDPRLLDVVWEVYREVGGKGPIHVVCGYRSPATNAMLRSRSRGVAKFSQHMLGRAMDFFIPGVPLETQREAGLRLQRGGVGYYPSSGSPFVHMDVGNVRHWPRMTREQLVRVFPNGRTVHVPTDGRPLPGYALALADIQNRKSSEPSTISLEARNAGVDAPAAQPQPQRNLFASLFTSKDEEEDNNDAAAQPATPPAQAAEPRDDKAEKVAKADAPRVPLPVARPTARINAKLEPKLEPKAPATFDLASAESRPVQLSASAARGGDDAAAFSSEVIASRGFWGPAAPAAPKQPVQVASAAPRPALAASVRNEPRPSDTTGAVAAPWPVKIADAADRPPSDQALAYAAQAGATPQQRPVTRGLAVGGAIPRNASTMAQPRIVAAAKPTPQVQATAAVLRPGTRFEDLWLRALILAPNLQSFMTATVLGPPDMRELSPLMRKPDAVVTMTFGDEPNPGLASDRFGGTAVVFVPTIPFAKRTAALQ
jgi:uncharacterized protein YcbK (DUF882 family)